MVAYGAADKEKVANGGIAPTATLDDAMSYTGVGLYNIAHMLVCGTILMGMIMQSLVLGYVIPAAQCDLALTLPQRGWLSAMPFIAIILTSHLWGWLADTRGRRPVMQYTMVLSFLLSVVSSFSPNLAVFAALQFLSSVFMSASSALTYTYLGEFNNLQHRDKMVAFGASFVGIGTVVLPALSWLILPLEFAYPIPLLGIDYRSWRLLVVACAVPFALGSILLIFAPESPKYLNATGQQQKCLDVVKKMYSVNKRASVEDFPVKKLINENQTSEPSESKTKVAGIWASMRDQTVPLFKMPLLPWMLLTCFVQFGIFSAVNGFYVWFPTILNALANHEGKDSSICDILDATTAQSDNGTAIICDDTMNTDTFERSIYIGLVFCSMYIIVGFLVDFLGKKLILIVIIGASGVCGICAHVVQSQQTGVILFAIFQMSGACIGLMNAVAVGLFPTKYRGMAICLSMMTGRVGSVMGSNLIGVFLKVNCGAGFYLFGGILILCALLCFTLPGKAKSKAVAQQTEEPTQNETHEPV